jgi:hypothetical protein
MSRPSVASLVRQLLAPLAVAVSVRLATYALTASNTTAVD